MFMGSLVSILMISAYLSVTEFYTFVKIIWMESSSTSS